MRPKSPQFEIIGEAMGRLLRDDPDTAQLIADHRRIIAFRNLLIHGCDVVDHAEVWSIASRHLPRLLEQVRSLLSAEGQSRDAHTAGP